MEALEDLESLTVVQLRAILKKMGIKTTGRKAELIDRIRDNKMLQEKKRDNRTPQENNRTQENKNKKLDEMSNLSVDVLVNIALDLDLSDVFALCVTSKRYNKAICDNKMFWLRRLQKDKMGYKNQTDFTNIEDYKTFYRERRKEYKDFLTKHAETFIERGDGDLNPLKMVIAMGSKYNYNIVNGDLFQKAVDLGHKKIVEYIIENIPVDQYHKDSSLKIAINNRNYEIAKFLIDNGANPYFDDAAALDIIYMNGDRDMIEFVESRGYSMDDYIKNFVKSKVKYNDYDDDDPGF